MIAIGLPLAVRFLLSTLESAGELILAVGLFSSRLERREGFAPRATAFVAAMLAAAYLTYALATDGAGGTAAYVSDTTSLIGTIMVFSLLLIAATFAVVKLFHASVWTALFCGTAGYVLQNFTSGLVELVLVLAGFPGDVDGAMRLARFGVNVACVAVVYSSFYFAFIRRTDRRGLEEINNRLLVAVMVVVMLGVIGSDVVIKGLSMETRLFYVVALRSMHGLLCALTYALEYELLVARHEEVEREATERVLAERERQYQLSRANVEAINVKCHDIRHQIRHLADGNEAVDADALASIAAEVAVYDAQAATGNEALDTILSEKGLAAAAANTTLTCVADGAALGFMAPADIYSFFGNALDNALEATGRLDDPALRSVSLVVRQVAGSVSIHVENYFDGTLARTADGGLATRKSDAANHGIGVRSMRLTVERYGGTLATLVEGNKFHVNALIPLG